MNVRLAKVKDAGDLINLQKQVYRPLNDSHVPTALHEDEGSIEKRLGNDAWRVYVTEQDGKMVASISYFVSSGDSYAYACRFCSLVPKEGHRLFNATREIFEGEGLEKVFCRVLKGDRRIALYKRVGFREATSKEKDCCKNIIAGGENSEYLTLCLKGK